jgi:hypothetical protein
MNERFKELVEKANGNFGEGCEFAVVFGELEDFERFVKMIVQECIDKIENYRIPVGNSAAGEMACEWTLYALKEIRDDIKEHFGVE